MKLSKWLIISACIIGSLFVVPTFKAKLHQIINFLDLSSSKANQLNTAKLQTTALESPPAQTSPKDQKTLAVTKQNSPLLEIELHLNEVLLTPNIAESALPDLINEILKLPNYQQLPLIQKLLVEYPYDAQLLIAEAQVFEVTGENISALENYNQAILFANTEALQSRANLRFLSLIKRVSNDLLIERRGNEVLDLYNKYEATMVDIDQWSEFHSNIAKVLLEQKDQLSIELFIEKWKHLQGGQLEIEQLLRQLNDEQKVTKAIPLSKHGQQFIVPVTINGASLQLLLDTGASMTILTNDAFEKVQHLFGRNPSQYLQFNTAGGIVEAPVFSRVNIAIEQFILEDTNIAVLDFNSRYDGLLGMNFLSRFKFEIDQDGSLLFLSLSN